MFSSVVGVVTKFDCIWIVQKEKKNLQENFDNFWLQNNLCELIHTYTNSKGYFVVKKWN